MADADGFRGRCILEKRIDGDEYRVVPPESGFSYRYMDLSPDGTLLAFVQCEGRNCDLWVMPALGGPAVPLTTHPAYDDTPRWSPDGTRIAFTSTRANSFDVWVMTLDLHALQAALDSAATAEGRRQRAGGGPAGVTVGQ